MAFNLTAQLNIALNSASLRAASNQLNTALNSNTQVKLGIDRNSSSGLKQIKSQIDESTNAMESFGKQSGLAAKRFAAFSVTAGAFIAFTAAAKEAVSAAIDFDFQMVKLGQVSSSSGNEIKNVASEITRLATNYGVSSKELGTVAITLKQANLSLADTKIALESLAQAALAPNFENLKDTTEGAIAIMNQFKIEAKDLGVALGSVNAVAGEFAVEAGDIIEAIRKTGGAFKAAGGNLNELIALFTSVRQTTRESAESISTGLRTIFTRIQRNDTVEALRAVNIQLRYTSDEARALGDAKLENQFVGPYEAVKRLSAGLKGLQSTDPRFSAIVEQLGGYRQISKVIPLINEFATAQKALGIAQAGSTSLSINAGQAQDALIIKFQKLKETFLEVGRNIVNSPGFRGLVDTFISASTSVLGLIDSLKGLLPLITALAAVKLFQGAASFTKGFLSAGSDKKDKKAEGGFLKMRTGGIVPGSGTGDKVPALLEPGEMVIPKGMVRRQMYANKGNVKANDSTAPAKLLKKSTSEEKVIDIENFKNLQGGSVYYGTSKGIGNQRASKTYQKGESIKLFDGEHKAKQKTKIIDSIINNYPIDFDQINIQRNQSGLKPLKNYDGLLGDKNKKSFKYNEDKSNTNREFYDLLKPYSDVFGKLNANAPIPLKSKTSNVLFKSLGNGSKEEKKKKLIDDATKKINVLLGLSNINSLDNQYANTIGIISNFRAIGKSLNRESFPTRKKNGKKEAETTLPLKNIGTTKAGNKKQGSYAPQKLEGYLLEKYVSEITNKEFEGGTERFDFRDVGQSFFSALNLSGKNERYIDAKRSGKAGKSVFEKQLGTKEIANEIVPLLAKGGPIYRQRFMNGKEVKPESEFLKNTFQPGYPALKDALKESGSLRYLRPIQSFAGRKGAFTLPFEILASSNDKDFWAETEGNLGKRKTDQFRRFYEKKTGIEIGQKKYSDERRAKNPLALPEANPKYSEALQASIQKQEESQNRRIAKSFYAYKEDYDKNNTGSTQERKEREIYVSKTMGSFSPSTGVSRVFRKPENFDPKEERDTLKHERIHAIQKDSLRSDSPLKNSFFNTAGQQSESSLTPGKQTFLAEVQANYGAKSKPSDKRKAALEFAASKYDATSYASQYHMDIANRIGMPKFDRSVIRAERHRKNIYREGFDNPEVIAANKALGEIIDKQPKTRKNKEKNKDWMEKLEEAQRILEEARTNARGPNWQKRLDAATEISRNKDSEQMSRQIALSAELYQKLAFGGSVNRQRFMEGNEARSKPFPKGLYPEEILGFTKGYIPQGPELTSAFRRAALIHHSDRGGLPENMAQVNAAFQRLKDRSDLKKARSQSGPKTANSPPKSNPESEEKMFRSIFGDAPTKDEARSQWKGTNPETFTTPNRFDSFEAVRNASQFREKEEKSKTINASSAYSDRLKSAKSKRGGYFEGGPIIRMKKGGIVPGSGSGDKVRALLEPGELVVPKHQVARQKFGEGGGPKRLTVGDKSVLFGASLGVVGSIVPLAASLLGMESIIGEDASNIAGLTYATLAAATAVGSGLTIGGLGNLAGKKIFSSPKQIEEKKQAKKLEAEMKIKKQYDKRNIADRRSILLPSGGEEGSNIQESRVATEELSRSRSPDSGRTLKGLDYNETYNARNIIEYRSMRRRQRFTDKYLGIKKAKGIFGAARDTLSKLNPFNLLKPNLKKDPKTGKLISDTKEFQEFQYERQVKRGDREYQNRLGYALGERKDEPTAKPVVSAPIAKAGISEQEALDAWGKIDREGLENPKVQSALAAWDKIHKEEIASPEAQSALAAWTKIYDEKPQGPKFNERLSEARVALNKAKSESEGPNWLNRKNEASRILQEEKAKARGPNWQERKDEARRILDQIRKTGKPFVPEATAKPVVSTPVPKPTATATAPIPTAKPVVSAPVSKPTSTATEPIPTAKPKPTAKPVVKPKNLEEFTNALNPKQLADFKQKIKTAKEIIVNARTSGSMKLKSVGFNFLGTKFNVTANKDLADKGTTKPTEEKPTYDLKGVKSLDELLSKLPPKHSEDLRAKIGRGQDKFLETKNIKDLNFAYDFGDKRGPLNIQIEKDVIKFGTIGTFPWKPKTPKEKRTEQLRVATERNAKKKATNMARTASTVDAAKAKIDNASSLTDIISGIDQENQQAKTFGIASDTKVFEGSEQYKELQKKLAAVRETRRMDETQSLVGSTDYNMGDISKGLSPSVYNLGYENKNLGRYKIEDALNRVKEDELVNPKEQLSLDNPLQDKIFQRSQLRRSERSQAEKPIGINENYKAPQEQQQKDIIGTSPQAQRLRMQMQEKEFENPIIGIAENQKTKKEPRVKKTEAERYKLSRKQSTPAQEKTLFDEMELAKIGTYGTQEERIKNDADKAKRFKDAASESARVKFNLNPRQQRRAVANENLAENLMSLRSKGTGKPVVSQAQAVAPAAPIPTPAPIVNNADTENVILKALAGKQNDFWKTIRQTTTDNSAVTKALQSLQAQGKIVSDSNRIGFYLLAGKNKKSATPLVSEPATTSTTQEKPQIPEDSYNEFSSLVKKPRKPRATKKTGAPKSEQSNFYNTQESEYQKLLDSINAQSRSKKGRRFASGGLVPGTGNSDTVPMDLPENSFVIRKSSVNKIGAANLAKQARFASGGTVPALVTPGEYIYTPEEAKKIGSSKLHSMNKYAKFARGGPIGLGRSGKFDPNNPDDIEKLKETLQEQLRYEDPNKDESLVQIEVQQNTDEIQRRAQQYTSDENARKQAETTVNTRNALVTRKTADVAATQQNVNAAAGNVASATTARDSYRNEASTQGREATRYQQQATTQQTRISNLMAGGATAADPRVVAATALFVTATNAAATARQQQVRATNAANNADAQVVIHTTTLNAAVIAHTQQQGHLTRAQNAATNAVTSLAAATLKAEGSATLLDEYQQDAAGKILLAGKVIGETKPLSGRGSMENALKRKEKDYEKQTGRKVGKDERETLKGNLLSEYRASAEKQLRAKSVQSGKPISELNLQATADQYTREFSEGKRKANYNKQGEITGDKSLGKDLTGNAGPGKTNTDYKADGTLTTMGSLNNFASRAAFGAKRTDFEAGTEGDQQFKQSRGQTVANKLIGGAALGGFVSDKISKSAGKPEDFITPSGGGSVPPDPSKEAAYKSTMAFAGALTKGTTYAAAAGQYLAQFGPLVAGAGAGIAGLLGAFQGYADALEEAEKAIREQKIAVGLKNLEDIYASVASGLVEVNDATIKNIQSNQEDIQKNKSKQLLADSGGNTSTTSSVLNTLSFGTLGSAGYDPKKYSASVSKSEKEDDARAVTQSTMVLNKLSSTLGKDSAKQLKASGKDITATSFEDQKPELLKKLRDENSGFGKSEIRKIASTQNISIPDAEKQFLAAMKDAFESEKAKEVSLKQIETNNKTIASMALLSGAVNAAAAAADSFNERLSLNDSLFEGNAGSTKITSQSDKIGMSGSNPNFSQFNSAISESSGLLGDYGQSFKAQGNAVNTASQILPEILANSAANPVSGKDPSAQIVDALRAGLKERGITGPEADKVVNSVGGKVSAEEFTKQLAEAGGDVGKATEKLLSDIKDPLVAAFKDIDAKLTEQSQAYISGLENLAKRQNQILQEFDKLSGLKSQQSSFRASEAQRSPNAKYGAEESKALDVARNTQAEKQMRLTGLGSGGSQDSGIIAAKLKEAEKRAEKQSLSLEQTPKDKQSGSAFRDAALELTKTKNEAANLKTALKNLTDQSGLLQAAQQKLASVRSGIDEKRGFGRKLLTQTPEDQDKMLRGQQIFNQVKAQGGSLQGMSTEENAVLFDFLDNFGSAGKKIQEQILDANGYGASQDDLSEEKALVALHDRLYQEQINAQQLYIVSQQGLQNEYFTKLEDKNKTFYSNLEKFTQELTKNEKSVEKNKEQQKLTKIEDVQKNAKPLSDVGIKTKEDFDLLSQNKGKVQDLANTKMERQDLKRVSGEKIDTKIERNAQGNVSNLTEIRNSLKEAGYKGPQIDEIAEKIAQSKSSGPANDEKILQEARNSVGAKSEERLQKKEEKQTSDLGGNEKLIGVSNNLASGSISSETMNRALDNIKELNLGTGDLGVSAEAARANIKRLETEISNLGGTQVGIQQVPAAAPQKPVGLALATGGSVFSPRGTDTVPAMLTPGEFVVNRNATKNNLGTLNQINSGKTKYLASGGITDDGITASAASSLFEPLEQIKNAMLESIGRNIVKPIASGSSFSSNKTETNSISASGSLETTNNRISQLVNLSSESNNSLSNIAEKVSSLLSISTGSVQVSNYKPEENAQGLQLANGGSVFAPRGTDTVPAMLTPGEFVVNRNATQQNLPLLKSINSGETSYLAIGGQVGPLTSSSGRARQYGIPVLPNILDYAQSALNIGNSPEILEKTRQLESLKEQQQQLSEEKEVHKKSKIDETLPIVAGAKASLDNLYSAGKGLIVNDKDVTFAGSIFGSKNRNLINTALMRMGGFGAIAGPYSGMSSFLNQAIQFMQKEGNENYKAKTNSEVGGQFNDKLKDADTIDKKYSLFDYIEKNLTRQYNTEINPQGRDMPISKEREQGILENKSGLQDWGNVAVAAGTETLLAVGTGGIGSGLKAGAIGTAKALVLAAKTADKAARAAARVGSRAIRASDTTGSVYAKYKKLKEIEKLRKLGPAQRKASKLVGPQAPADIMAARAGETAGNPAFRSAAETGTFGILGEPAAAATTTATTAAAEAAATTGQRGIGTILSQNLGAAAEGTYNAGVATVGGIRRAGAATAGGIKKAGMGLARNSDTIVQGSILPTAQYLVNSSEQARQEKERQAREKNGNKSPEALQTDELTNSSIMAENYKNILNKKESVSDKQSKNKKVFNSGLASTVGMNTIGVDNQEQEWQGSESFLQTQRLHDVLTSKLEYDEVAPDSGYNLITLMNDEFKSFSTIEGDTSAKTKKINEEIEAIKLAIREKQTKDSMASAEAGRQASIKIDQDLSKPFNTITGAKGPLQKSTDIDKQIKAYGGEDFINRYVKNESYKKDISGKNLVENKDKFKKEDELYQGRRGSSADMAKILLQRQAQAQIIIGNLIGQQNAEIPPYLKDVNSFGKYKKDLKDPKWPEDAKPFQGHTDDFAVKDVQEKREKIFQQELADYKKNNLSNPVALDPVDAYKQGQVQLDKIIDKKPSDITKEKLKASTITPDQKSLVSSYIKLNSFDKASKLTGKDLINLTDRYKSLVSEVEYETKDSSGKPIKGKKFEFTGSVDGIYDEQIKNRGQANDIGGDEDFIKASVDGEVNLIKLLGPNIFSKNIQKSILKNKDKNVLDTAAAIEQKMVGSFVKFGKGTLDKQTGMLNATFGKDPASVDISGALFESVIPPNLFDTDLKNIEVTKEDKMLSASQILQKQEGVQGGTKTLSRFNNLSFDYSAMDFNEKLLPQIENQGGLFKIISAKNKDGKWDRRSTEILVENSSTQKRFSELLQKSRGLTAAEGDIDPAGGAQGVADIDTFDPKGDPSKQIKQIQKENKRFKAIQAKEAKTTRRDIKNLNTIDKPSTNLDPKRGLTRDELQNSTTILRDGYPEFRKLVFENEAKKDISKNEKDLIKYDYIGFSKGVDISSTKDVLLGKNVESLSGKINYNKIPEPTGNDAIPKEDDYKLTNLSYPYAEYYNNKDNVKNIVDEDFSTDDKMGGYAGKFKDFKNILAKVENFYKFGEVEDLEKPNFKTMEEFDKYKQGYQYKTNLMKNEVEFQSKSILGYIKNARERNSFTDKSIQDNNNLLTPQTTIEKLNSDTDENIRKIEEDKERLNPLKALKPLENLQNAPSFGATPEEIAAAKQEMDEAYASLAADKLEYPDSPVRDLTSYDSSNQASGKYYDLILPPRKKPNNPREESKEFVEQYNATKPQENIREIQEAKTPEQINNEIMNRPFTTGTIEGDAVLDNKGGIRIQGNPQQEEQRNIVENYLNSPTYRAIQIYQDSLDKIKLKQSFDSSPSGVYEDNENGELADTLYLRALDNVIAQLKPEDAITESYKKYTQLFREQIGQRLLDPTQQFVSGGAQFATKPEVSENKDDSLKGLPDGTYPAKPGSIGTPEASKNLEAMINAGKSDIGKKPKISSNQQYIDALYDEVTNAERALSAKEDPADVIDYELDYYDINEDKKDFYEKNQYNSEAQDKYRNENDGKSKAITANESFIEITNRRNNALLSKNPKEASVYLEAKKKRDEFNRKIMDYIQKNDIKTGDNFSIDSLPPLYYKATGGSVPSYRANPNPSYFKPKGTDTVPAMLSPGEFVINASATAKHGDLLSAINSGQDVGYSATGGPVAYLKRGKSRKELQDKAGVDLKSLKPLGPNATRQERLAQRNAYRRLGVANQNERLQNESLAVEKNLIGNTEAQKDGDLLQQIGEGQKRVGDEAGNSAREASIASLRQTGIGTTQISPGKDEEDNQKDEQQKQDKKEKKRRVMPLAPFNKIQNQKRFLNKEDDKKGTILPCYGCVEKITNRTIDTFEDTASCESVLSSYNEGCGKPIVGGGGGGAGGGAGAARPPSPGEQIRQEEESRLLDEARKLIFGELEVFSKGGMPKSTAKKLAKGGSVGYYSCGKNGGCGSTKTCSSCESGGPSLFNDGGLSLAPSDTIPAMLTPGEFVVNAKSSAKNASLLHDINSGKDVEGFATGGSVGYYAGGKSSGGSRASDRLSGAARDLSASASELSNAASKISPDQTNINPIVNSRDPSSTVEIKGSSFDKLSQVLNSGFRLEELSSVLKTEIRINQSDIGAMLGGMGTFGNSVGSFCTCVDKFSSSATNFNTNFVAALTNFNTYISDLKAAAALIPTTINVKGNINTNVSVGMDATTIQFAVQQVVQDVSDEMKRMINDAIDRTENGI